jgi:hypothetical protein
MAALGRKLPFALSVSLASFLVIDLGRYGGIVFSNFL